MKIILHLAKFIVFLVNFAAMLVFGLFLSALVFVFMRSESLFGTRIEPSFHPASPTALYFTLIVIGFLLAGFFFMLTCMGCYGAACQHKCMVGCFVLIMSLLSMLTVLSLLYIFLNYESEMDMFAQELDKTLHYYDPVEERSIVRYLWDNVQTKMQCCGVLAVTDWNDAKSLKPGRRVPVSCCQRGSDDCVFAPEYMNVHPQGCLAKIELHVRTVFWAVPITIASMLMLSFFIYIKSTGKYEEVRGRRITYVRNPQKSYASRQQQQQQMNYGPSAYGNGQYNNQGSFIPLSDQEFQQRLLHQTEYPNNGFGRSNQFV